MVNCAVVGCANNSARNNTVSYHKLPSETKNPDIRHAWLQRIAIEDPDRKQTFILRKNCYVCSEHFEEEDYVFSVKFLLTHLPNHRTNRILKKSAVPSKNLILKSRRKSAVKNTGGEISKVKSQIKIGSCGLFLTDSADSADFYTNANQLKNQPKAGSGVESSGEPIFSEEYGKNQSEASDGSWKKNPKRPEMYKNPGQFSELIHENNGAFKSEAGFDWNFIINPNKSAISDMTSLSGSALVKPDPLKLEEPPDDYEPPLPVCKISEDVETQCELGSESYENASKPCQMAPVSANLPAKKQQIRLKKLSDLVGKPIEDLLRSNSPSDFIVCTVDLGVQCQIGKELYKNVLRSGSSGIKCSALFEK